jgi:3',5'-cyclic-AMP phosphodiesterase
MLAQLSDPHIRLGDDAPDRALAAAVAAVVALDPAPDAVLVSGDLADTGDPREYARVRELLAPLPMPYHVLPGNHDNVPELEKVFGPAEYAVDAGDLRLVAIDSTIPGGPGDGRVPVDRIASQLNGGKPTIVAMHHAPLVTGVAPMDALGVPREDREALAQLLARHPEVKRIVTGHLHRTIVGAVGGVPIFTCPGVHLQLELDFTGGEIDTNDDPPGYALHLLLDGEVTSHVILLEPAP